MATGNEILAYKGDPALAFGSNALPAGSNDAVFDFSPSIAAWQHYADNKLAVARDLADELKRKQLQKQAEIAKALEGGQFAGWEKSDAWLKPKVDEFRELVVDVAKKGNWDNYNDPDFNKVLSMQDELLTGVKYSMQQKEHYLTGYNYYQEHQDKLLPESLKSVNAYADESDPFKRAQMEYNMIPQAGWNVYDKNDEIVKGIVTENPDGVKSQDVGGGNLLYSIPVAVDQSKLAQRINANLDATRQGTNGYEYEFTTQPQAIQQHYSTQADPARAWAFDMKLNSMPLDLGTKNSIHQFNFAPAYTQEPKPMMNWIVDNALSLSDPTSDVYTENVADNKGKVIGRASHAFDNLFVQTTGKDAQGKAIYSAVKGIYNIGGKIYANTEAKESKTGVAAKKDLVEITSPYTQLIIPYSNQQYGSSPALAKGIEDLTTYGQGIDKNNFLKIPNNQPKQSQSTGTKTYLYKNTTFTEAEVQKKADVSGMTLDEYIKAAGLK